MANVSLYALTAIMPIDLKIMERTSLHRAKTERRCLLLNSNHLIERPITPAEMSHPADRCKITYERIFNQEELQLEVESNDLIFTDGSKLNDQVGSAWVRTNKEATIETAVSVTKLGTYCSVFQAEALAL